MKYELGTYGGALGKYIEVVINDVNWADNYRYASSQRSANRLIHSLVPLVSLWQNRRHAHRQLPARPEQQRERPHAGLLGWTVHPALWRPAQLLHRLCGERAMGLCKLLQHMGKCVDGEWASERGIK